MGYNLPFAQGMRLIELGGGDKPLLKSVGAVNLDARQLPTVDIVADFNKSLPIGAAEYDGAFGHYLLEHISWRQVRPFVQEVHRILKPRGIAVFFTANTEAQMRVALELPQDGHWIEKVSQMIMGDQDYPENSHKVVFGPKTLVDLFLWAGFSRVDVYEHDQTVTDCIVEAAK